MKLPVSSSKLQFIYIRAVVRCTYRDNMKKFVLRKIVERFEHIGNTLYKNMGSFVIDILV